MKKILLTFCGLMILGSALGSGVNYRLLTKQRLFLDVLRIKDTNLPEGALKEENRAYIMAIANANKVPYYLQSNIEKLKYLQENGIAPDSDGAHMLDVVMRMNGVNL